MSVMLWMSGKSLISALVSAIVRKQSLLAKILSDDSDDCFDCFPGAAFTRFQTLRLQKIFPECLSNQLISYGSCQFPTLGFVVERFKAIQAFIPETFFKIKGMMFCLHGL